MTTKVEEVEKRLQFAIIAGMFYPILLEALLNFAGAEVKELSKVILQSGLVIFFLIVNYLIFEWRKGKITTRFLDYLNWTFSTLISWYAFAFLLLSLIPNETMPVNPFTELMYGFAFLGVIGLPIVSIAIMVLEPLVLDIKALIKRGSN